MGWTLALSSTMSMQTSFDSDILCMNWNKGEGAVGGGIIVDISTRSTLGLFVLWKSPFDQNMGTGRQVARANAS